MISQTELIDRYFEAWNETDPHRRRELIARTWTEDSTYIDPLATGEGRNGIDAMIATVQKQFPSLKFRRVTEVDAHNDRVRFSSELGPTTVRPLLAASISELLAMGCFIQ